MRSRLITTLLLLCLYGLLGGAVVLPYLRFNHVLGWDSIGHLFSAWHIREHLWPAPTGWNPYFFAGFPQGTFYPPLFHWAVAALSFLLPLTAAFKGLVALAILATPLAFYRFARSYLLTTSSAAAAATLMSGLLIAPITYSLENNFVGGSFVSTFNIGLVAQAVALPLLFLYFATLGSSLQRGRTVAPSLLLASLVLTHLYTAFAAAFFLAVWVATEVRTRPAVLATVKHAALTAGLTAFWIVPFLAFVGESATVRVSLTLGLGSFLLALVGLALVLVLLFRGRAQQAAALIAYFLLMTIGLLTLNYVDLPVHAYRLILPPLLLVPIFLLRAISVRWHPVIGIAGLALIIWGLTIPSTSAGHLELRGTKSLSWVQAAVDFPQRTFLLSSPQYQEDFHTNQHRLPMAEKVWLNKGLFVESSRTAQYLLTLERMLDPASMAWGVPFRDGSAIPKAEQRRILDDHLRRFGFQAVLAPTVQDRFSFVARERAFSSPVPHEHAVITFNGRTSNVLLRQDPLYFALADDALVLVDHERGFYNFTFFKRPELPDRAALIVGETTYYVNRLDDVVSLIDFRLSAPPDAHDITALEQLRQDAARLPADLRREFEADLARLQDELERSNVDYARRKYANDPTIRLERLGAVQVREDQLQTASVSRPVQFFLYRLPANSLVEALNVEPVVVSTSWERAVNAWFLSTATAQTLVQAGQEMHFPTHDAKVEDIEIAPNGNRLAFSVVVDRPTPILIKMSYFPKWRATADGRPISIYRAAPNLMLVYARGRIELRYATLWYERIAQLVTLLCLAGLAIWYLLQLVLGHRSRALQR